MSGKVFLSLALALTVTLPLSAQAMPGTADRYDVMDANKDNRVTWEEFEKAIPSMKKEAFDTIDTNKDTALSREEWNAFRQTHGMKQAPAPEQGKPLIMPPKK